MLQLTHGGLMDVILNSTFSVNIFQNFFSGGQAEGPHKYANDSSLIVHIGNNRVND